MRVYVLSHKHHLLPFAWRLKREGHDVSVAVVHAGEKWERAWSGKLPRCLEGAAKISAEGAATLRTKVEAEEAYVLTDSRVWTANFEGYPRCFGVLPEQGTPSPLSLGAWFNGSEFRGVHLLVEDRGAWPHGLGPQVAAAMTLVRPTHVCDALLGLLDPDPLKAAGFRGLVRVGFHVEHDAPVADGVVAGWPFLATHVYVSEIVLTSALEGQEPGLRRFVVGVVVSVPPWPLQCNLKALEAPVEGLEDADYRRVNLHDVSLEGGVATAGLDGLVAVVRGAGEQLALARAEALDLAARLQVPEKQYRPDAGDAVNAVLCQLERAGWVLA